MEKLFSVAGTSNLEGVVKFRVANGSAAARAKVLERSGHTDIKLVDLAKPMSKEDAITFIKSKGFTFGVDKLPMATKPAKTPKLKVVKTKAPAKVKATKEVPAAEIIEEVGLVVARKGAPTTKSMEEISKIKSKNLETMRKVTNKLAALRNYN